MQVLDPGYKYVLTELDDVGEIRNLNNVLQFVKREGEKYLGNIGHYPGTTTQEVLRVLIDRTKYVNNQISSHHNEQVVRYLRCALIALETRAAEAADHATWIGNPNLPIEEWPTCSTCGHIWCDGRRHGSQIPAEV